uniref:Uncharacterized protein n=1 Tax=Trichuris muris TaxID=70415 RepID=A0A5S6QQ01_TRIMR
MMQPNVQAKGGSLIAKQGYQGGVETPSASSASQQHGGHLQYTLGLRNGCPALKRPQTGRTFKADLRGFRKQSNGQAEHTQRRLETDQGWENAAILLKRKAVRIKRPILQGRNGGSFPTSAIRQTSEGAIVCKTKRNRKNVQPENVGKGDTQSVGCQLGQPTGCNEATPWRTVERLGVN